MNRPNLILLHGALGSKSYFKNLEKLLNKDYQVFTFDFSGHGQSESSYHFSIDGFKDQLIDFCINNKIKNASVFGYSMGGYIALYAASERPNLFKSIVSLGTKFQWSPEISKKETQKLNPELIEEKVPDFAVYLQELHGYTNWKTMVLNTKNLMLDLGANNRIDQIDLSKIKIPVFIGLGTKDKMVSEEESKEIVSRLSYSKFESFPDFLHPFERLDTVILAERIKLYL